MKTHATTRAQTQAPTARRRPATQPLVREVVASPGRELDPRTRTFMEGRFGHDFSRVRVHTDARAAESARSVNALAYTVGRDIAFDAGQYAPETAAGRHLLAHELAHTVQQRDARAPRESEGLEVDAPGSAYDRDADQAAARAARGARAEVRTATGPALARMIQRAEKGTYVSKLGASPYLDAGEQFYKTWGHPNVRRVSTMKDVLDDLDTETGTIDSFRLVSHGSSLGMEIGLLPEISPDYFNKEGAELTTEAKFRAHLAGARLISESNFTNLLGFFQKDSKTKPHLATLGADSTVPAADTPLGILLRAVMEDFYISTVNIQPDTPGGKPKFAHRAEMDKHNQSRIDTYLKVVVEATPEANRKAVKQAVTDLRAALPTTSWKFSDISEGEAQTQADPILEDDPASPGKKRYRKDLSKAMNEGAGGGPYLKRLRSVQGKIDAKTHVEIRGCNVGANTGYLDAVRAYFGGSHPPSISAPDLYQYFFQLNFTAYGNAPSEETAMQNAYNDPATGVAQGFEESRRTRAGEMMRVVNEKTLAELARKYGLTAARLQDLNPEITDPDKLSPGQIVWLMQRKVVPAGVHTKLEDFCAKYLGDKAHLKAVQAANPQLTNPDALKPTDQITLPQSVLTPPVASDTPTFADYKAKVRAGLAVVGQNTTANRPELSMDNPKRAKALADWLAAQKFDPKGRTADELSKLYAGKKFAERAAQTYIHFLSRDYPNIVDPIFPDDPRHDKHIIRRP